MPKKPTIIHFIRHGKTQNPQQIIKGRLKGFPLRVDGMVEVKKLADFIKKGHNIALIFYSPLLRARQTAEILSVNLGEVKIKPAEDLNEWDVKIWEGRPLLAVQKTKEWVIYLNQIMALNNLKIGERPKQVIARMLKCVKNILRTRPGQEIICVSHEDPIKFIRCELEKKDPNKYFHKIKCDQPSITTFIFGGQKLKQVKYKSFLDGQPEFLQ